DAGLAEHLDRAGDGDSARIGPADIELSLRAAPERQQSLITKDGASHHRHITRRGDIRERNSIGIGKLRVLSAECGGRRFHFLNEALDRTPALLFLGEDGAADMAGYSERSVVAGDEEHAVKQTLQAPHIAL